MVPLASMTNILSDDKRKQVLALGQLGWTHRRIEHASRAQRATFDDGRADQPRGLRVRCRELERRSSVDELGVR